MSGILISFGGNEGGRVRDTVEYIINDGAVSTRLTHSIQGHPVEPDDGVLSLLSLPGLAGQSRDV